ncbi:MAG TPA: HAD-IB family phosphatase [Terriglobia bacterium]|nr:HAD-IB family phosphatase [Terriglobia bacterium]
MVSAVIFDLDGTLTGTPNPWRYVHERLGLWDTVAFTHMDDWLSGRSTYDEFCRRDIQLWSGRDISEIHGFLDEIVFNRHVPEVVGALVERRIPSVIISSGFRYVARKLQSNHKWEPLLIYANELVAGPDVRIDVSADWSSPLSKKAHADAALSIVGAAAQDTLVVSDAAHDLEQLRDCGFHLHVRQEDDLLRTLSFLSQP